MPADKSVKTYALYDENGIPHSEFKRVCLRCRRPIRGYGYQTFYGIFIRPNGTRVPAGGEPLHDICPPKDAGPRNTPHHADEFFGEENGARKRGPIHRTEKKIETGIYLQHNGRYAVRVKNKRLGTYETIEQARNARESERMNGNGRTKQ